MLNVTTVWGYAHRPKLRLISKLTNADAAARKASGSWHGERSLKRRAIMRPIILKCESRKAAQNKNTEVQMWRWWVADITSYNRAESTSWWLDGCFRLTWMDDSEFRWSEKKNIVVFKLWLIDEKFLCDADGNTYVYSSEAVCWMDPDGREKKDYNVSVAQSRNLRRRCAGHDGCERSESEIKGVCENHRVVCARVRSACG